MNKNEFMEHIFELAFGEDAINKGYLFEEVIEKIKEYSDKSWEYDESN